MNEVVNFDFQLKLENKKNKSITRSTRNKINEFKKRLCCRLLQKRVKLK